MNFILWLVLVMGYGLLSWAAEKRSFARAALCFLNGGYLAFLCFAVLPTAMGTVYFFPAAGAAAVGVLAGFRFEEKMKAEFLVFLIVTGCQVFWQPPYLLREILLLSCLGGMGLYHASAGIIPEKIEIEKALLSGAGFLAGTFLFVGF